MMIKTPYFTQLQASHQYQGKTNNCGPYCAAITAKALGFQNADGLKFSNALHTYRWKGILPIFQRVPKSATMPWGTTYLLQLQQLNSRWEPFATEYDLLSNLTNDNVQIVIIGEWRPVWAHYMVFAAYDAVRGYGFIDPAYKDSKIHWYEPAEFSKLWRHYGKILIRVFPPDYSFKIKDTGQ
jgi:hypothetical protein